MLKRWVMALYILLLMTATAAAHTASVFASASLKGDRLAIKLFDVYQVPVEGASVTAAGSKPGEKPGKKLPLAEVEPGVYAGAIVLPGSGAYRVHVDVLVGVDLFRAEMPASAGEDATDITLVMNAIEPQEPFDWGPYLFAAAGIVLATATTVAILRRRQLAAEEGSESQDGG